MVTGEWRSKIEDDLRRTMKLRIEVGIAETQKLRKEIDAINEVVNGEGRENLLAKYLINHVNKPYHKDLIKLGLGYGCLGKMQALLEVYATGGYRLLGGYVVILVDPNGTANWVKDETYMVYSGTYPTDFKGTILRRMNRGFNTLRAASDEEIVGFNERWFNWQLDCRIKQEEAYETAREAQKDTKLSKHAMDAYYYATKGTNATTSIWVYK
jgi:hypothetical protein